MPRRGGRDQYRGKGQALAAVARARQWTVLGKPIQNVPVQAVLPFVEREQEPTFSEVKYYDPMRREVL